MPQIAQLEKKQSWNSSLELFIPNPELLPLYLKEDLGVFILQMRHREGKRLVQVHTDS